MKAEFPGLQELPWFGGRAVIEPEFEVTGERENIGRGRYYETAVVFYINTPTEAPSTEPALSADEHSRPQTDTPEWPLKRPFQPHILIMKGGGVKGIAYVGALNVLEEYGFKFRHFAGSSAGAITAALLAVGYSPAELCEVLKRTDFRKFKDGWLIPSLILLPLRKGIYKGDKFRAWLEELLRKKFPQYSNAIDIRFHHLTLANRPYRRLTIFASTKNRRSLPFDSDGPAATRPEKISFACRCSMAIPFLFIPERISGERVLDGGVQNNYPVYALLAADPSLKDSADFLGLYLGDKTVKRGWKLLLLNLYSIWSDAGNEEAKEMFIDRTIVIDPSPIKTIDFSLTPKAVEFLLAEGKASALRWLYHWFDGTRPASEEVLEAEGASATLREIVIAERWKWFWPRLAMLIFLLLLILSAVTYEAYV